MAQHRSRDAERFLRPERYRWQDPNVVLKALGLAPGMTLVDFGSGPGFFSLPAARSVGPSGQVYAVDLDPAMLERLRERAADEGVANLEYVVSPGRDLPLADAMADVVLIANVLHEVPERIGVLGEVARVLKPSGVLGIVEWRKEQTDMGPPVAERLDYEETVSSLRAAGYGNVEPFEVGPYHYGARATKS